MKTSSLALISAVTLGLPLGAMASTVVYQDSFDNDGIATNTGVGGGGTAATFNGGGGTDWGFDDTDNATNNLFAGTAASGNRISTFVSDNSFDLSAGFTLTVVFDQLFNDDNGSNASAPFLANHLSFGLVDSNPDSNLFQTNGSAPTAEGIGFSAGTRNSNVDIGVIEWDLSAGTTTTLDAITGSTEGDDLEFVLTVDSAGNYSWTFGSESGSGTTALDLTTEYFFKARTQASDGTAIESVTLTVVPEPGSLALLGLGGVLVARRRRS